ncbi:MAG TPA: hypothetical protein VGB42_11545 [Candidatus Thermoplasmatota archaeon]
MPGDYHYLDDSDAYVTVYWGTISILDILETISNRARDPDLKEARVHVIDLSNATWVEVQPAVLHDQVDKLRPAFAPPKVRTMFVTPGEFFYGFARFYAIVQIVYASRSVEVVRSWDAAAAAAGLDLSSARAWVTERVALG